MQNKCTCEENLHIKSLCDFCHKGHYGEDLSNEPCINCGCSIPHSNCEDLAKQVDLRQRITDIMCYGSHEPSSTFDDMNWEELLETAKLNGLMVDITNSTIEVAEKCYCCKEEAYVSYIKGDPCFLNDKRDDTLSDEDIKPYCKSCIKSEMLCEE